MTQYEYWIEDDKTYITVVAVNGLDVYNMMTLEEYNSANNTDCKSYSEDEMIEVLRVRCVEKYCTDWKEISYEDFIEGLEVLQYMKYQSMGKH